MINKSMAFIHQEMAKRQTWFCVGVFFSALVAIYLGFQFQSNIAVFLLLAFLFSVLLLLQDINTKKLLEAHKRNEEQREYFIKLILNLLSRKAPLPEIFETLIHFFEQTSEDSICSILFLNKEKTHFEKIYAPGLPDFYNEAISKAKIGLNEGSCGRAAFTGEKVFVEDIFSSPFWAKYSEIAKAANVSACWSQPIKTLKGEVIGSFAIYHRSPQVPTKNDIHTIEEAAELVAIIFDQYENEMKASQAQAHASILYQASIDPMWLIDIEPGPVYRFKSINESFTKVTGLTKENVLEKTVREVLPESSIELVRSKYLEATNTGNIVDYLEIANLPAGLRVGQIRVKSIKNEKGVVTQILGIAEDITERYQLENDLKDALKVRDEFIAVASHELKTPLTTMQLGLHSITRTIKDENIQSEKLSASLEKVKVQNERLGALIKNLLDVTKIRFGKLQLELKKDMNFSALVESVISNYAEEIQKTGSVLTKHIEPGICSEWDEFRLEQVVTNLLSNAMKYGNGKPIEINFSRKEKMAVLVVKDHGIGIPRAKQEKIFERFTRAVNETNYKGLGLGLWIAKEIVDSLNGEIHVQSDEGQGSTFTVELPIKD